jgi:CheY-like chemotaxis protein
MPRILIIDDDLKTANAICAGLRGEGFDAMAAPSGEAGLSNSTPTRSMRSCSTGCCPEAMVSRSFVR